MYIGSRYLLLVNAFKMHRGTNHVLKEVGDCSVGAANVLRPESSAVARGYNRDNIQGWQISPRSNGSILQIL